jgi:2',3'-cyclic-nucleotide 2'-phosphodiesterase (5'-nucleotidase family)
MHPDHFLDAGVLQELKPWADKVAQLTTQSVGKTIVYLNGSQSSCRMRECNIGNLIADSFVQYVNPGTFRDKIIKVKNFYYIYV